MASCKNSNSCPLGLKVKNNCLPAISGKDPLVLVLRLYSSSNKLYGKDSAIIFNYLKLLDIPRNVVMFSSLIKCQLVDENLDIKAVLRCCINTHFRDELTSVSKTIKHVVLLGQTCSNIILRGKYDFNNNTGKLLCEDLGYGEVNIYPVYGIDEMATNTSKAAVLNKVFLNIKDSIGFSKTSKLNNTEASIRVDDRQHKQIEGWKRKLDELDAWFNSIKLPDHPVKLDACTTINDVRSYINGELYLIKYSKGNKVFSSNLNRLIRLKEKF